MTLSNHFVWAVEFLFKDSEEMKDKKNVYFQISKSSLSSLILEMQKWFPSIWYYSDVLKYLGSVDYRFQVNIHIYIYRNLHVLIYRIIECCLQNITIVKYMYSKAFSMCFKILVFGRKPSAVVLNYLFLETCSSRGVIASNTFLSRLKNFIITFFWIGVRFNLSCSNFLPPFFAKAQIIPNFPKIT